MRIGKISESVLNRSILKIIKNKKTGIVSAAVTSDCAYFANEQKDYSVTSVNTMTVNCCEMAYYAVHNAANNLFCSGAKPVMVSLNILLDENSEESDLKNIMRDAKRAADELGIDILGGHTEVTNAVSRPFVSAYVAGYAEEKPEPEKVSAGDAIIMTKYAGIMGSAIFAKECHDKLLQRLPDYLIRETADFSGMVSIKDDYLIGKDAGAYCFHDVSGGGIFAALWELSRITSKGLDVDIKKIPIRQETIEITNYLSVNPYLLMSGGSLLMISDKPEEVIAAYENAGICAMVIGTLTDSNDKIVRNDDEVRFLDKPQTDEIHKLDSLRG